MTHCVSTLTYALRGCHGALIAGPKRALASSSQVAAGGGRWLLMAVRGHLGDTPRPGLSLLGYEQDDLTTAMPQLPLEFAP